MNPETRQRLDLLLAKTGVATPDVLHAMRGEVPRAIPSTLVNVHGCDRELVLDVLAEVYRMPAVSFTDEPVDEKAMGNLSPEFCLHCMAVPVGFEDGHTVVAFADPEDLVAVGEMQAAIGKPILERVALASDIHNHFARQRDEETVQDLVEEILADEDEAEDENAPPVRLNTQSEARKPIVRLLDELVQDAVKRQAEQVCLLPHGAQTVHVRQRKGEKVVETRRYPMRLHSNVVNRLRLLCDLVGKDKRVSQRGAYQTVVNERKHRVDVLIVPHEAGDTATLFLDQGDEFSAIDGASDAACAKCQEVLRPEWQYCPHCGLPVEVKSE